jgi:hypothetical protein
MTHLSRLIVLLAVTLSACASTGDNIESDPWLDAGRIKRIGVPPFQDAAGRGRAAAEKVRQGLERMGLQPVDPKQLEATLDRLGVDAGKVLGAESLNEIRQTTKADALLFGSLGPDKKHGLAIYLLDAESGDVLVRAALSRGFKTADEAAEATLKILSGPLGKPGGLAPQPVPQEPDLPLPEQ